ncbi:unnamed protein product [Ambrosiozyma monospora]|uniref:Unnamed protein product n=1 Tax=Ambrosiozyma monospora TaxID=43982 RepID=A0ACB5SZT4_AMBMO|nr:unnamed protein product [Ambrosiozyma monospora]
MNLSKLRLERLSVTTVHRSKLQQKHTYQLFKMATITTVKKQAEFVLKTPLLRQLFVPVAKTFTYLSGYRNLGLRYA